MKKTTTEEAIHAKRERFHDLSRLKKQVETLDPEIYANARGKLRSRVIRERLAAMSIDDEASCVDDRKLWNKMEAEIYLTKYQHEFSEDGGRTWSPCADSVSGPPGCTMRPRRVWGVLDGPG